MEQFIGNIAKYNKWRTQHESGQLCVLRRYAYRIWHVSSCVESPRRCEYNWCEPLKTSTNHPACSEDCWDRCNFFKCLFKHLVLCADMTCSLCPFKHHDIDDMTSEEEADEENGERVMMFESDDDPEAAEDED